MDDNTPATKADLRKLEQSMNERFVRVDEKFEMIDEHFVKIDEQFVKIDEKFVKIDEKFERVHEDSDRILDVLINVDKKMGTKIDDHEKRITRLEERVMV